MRLEPRFRGAAIAVAAFLIAALLIFLSGRQTTTPEGLPLISTREEFETTLRRVVDGTKGILETWDRQGSITDAERKELRESARLCESLRYTAPENYLVHMLSAKIYLALGEQQLALERIRQCLNNIPIQTDPSIKEEVRLTEIEARYVLSLVLVSLGDYEQAYREANAAAEAIPSSANYLAARASALVQLKRLNEARRDVEAALRLDPEHTRSLQLRRLLVNAGGS